MGGKLSSKEAKFKEAINHGTISKQQLHRLTRAHSPLSCAMDK